jgi:pantothenate synthetase
MRIIEKVSEMQSRPTLASGRKRIAFIPTRATCIKASKFCVPLADWGLDADGIFVNPSQFGPERIISYPRDLDRDISWLPRRDRLRPLPQKGTPRLSTHVE